MTTSRVSGPRRPVPRALGRALSAFAGSPRRIWLGAFLGFFMIFGAWAFAAPFDGPPDEVQHVIRAAGVVSGQFAPAPAVISDWNGKGARGLGAYQNVPEGLDSPATCWGFDVDTPASCATPIHGGPLADVPTSAGRYNPTYYLLVGAPVRLWPAWGGLVLSRLISAALSAALLAFSFLALVRWSRLGLMLAGLLAASTPMLAHLAGAVNPNGLEITAGIALFSAGIPMLLDERHVTSRKPLYWLFGVSAVLLALIRPLGPLWLVCAVASLLLGVNRARIRELWSTRLVRNWTLGAGVALLVSAAWTLAMKTGDVVPPDDKPQPHYGVVHSVMTYIGDWDIYLRGMVGVAGWFDISMPSPLYWVWICAAASLLLLALVAGPWRDRMRFFVIFLGGFVAPGIMQVAEANTLGFNIIGGRYMLPLVVGIPLLGAFVVERGMVTGHHARSMTRMFVLLLLPIQLTLLLYSMIRWQRGAGSEGINFLRGEWHPPTGSLLPMVLMVAGLVIIGYLHWRGLALLPAAAGATVAVGTATSNGTTVSTGRHAHGDTNGRAATAGLVGKPAHAASGEDR